MLTLFFRAMILYIVMVITMRGLGRRQLGQYQPYEFAMTILLADVISTPMESVSTPLLQGLLPVAAMFVVHCAISLLSMKSDKFRAAISGKPSVVISKGVIDEKELRRLCLSLSDLLEGMRLTGIMNPSEVGTAVIEANGSLSAFPRSSKRPLNADEMGYDLGYEGLPMILIMDGRVQKNNLAQCKRDEKWLSDTLNGIDMSIENTYFAYVDTQGVLTAQAAGGGARQVNCIHPDEVMW